MELATVHRPDPDLEQSVHRLAPRLLRFARGHATTGTVALAEEAAQDALMALVDRWRRLGPPESPEAFAFTVLRRRLARASIRHALSRPLSALRSGGSDSDERPSPERCAQTRDELRMARDGLRRLSPKLRDALLLAVAGELDVDAAAQVLGISPSAFKMRVSRARTQLRERMERRLRNYEVFEP